MSATTSPLHPGAKPSQSSANGAPARLASVRLRTDLLIYLAITALTLSAWWISTQGWFTSWSPTGYWLGVAGGVSMLLLFTYPLRKRWRVTYNWGASKYWFVAHMVLGILGPWLILLHSTFRIGSTNAAVALFSMIIVALSGVIGRFLYVRLHADLRGEKATLASLRGAMGQEQQAADTQFHSMPGVLQAMQAFERQTLADGANHGARHLWRLFVLPIQRQRVTQQCKAEVKKLIKQAVDDKKWSKPQALKRYRTCCEQIDSYATSVQRAAQFQTFERLFSLWHVAHVPFVWVMVLCAIFHVVAVHAY
ncbi:MAG: hypothetical protein EPO09_17005 [Aquabacterium sp.]|uniref:hypothetical protein n=1 Tax=Aquabacterium sp. TaxID=1872578 RepID=UPI0012246915|nr:hypothetical protein [Aquabacterium sp.]TAK90117.1 MAG: hypothetical protein EPO09_17005 [Aquabacterium sp.]